jgi:hypothetical protein
MSLAKEEACSLAISNHLGILPEEKTSKIFMVGIERGLCHALGITQKPYCACFLFHKICTNMAKVVEFKVIFLGKILTNI